MLYRYKQFLFFPYEYLFHLRRMVHDEAKDYLIDSPVKVMQIQYCSR